MIEDKYNVYEELDGKISSMDATIDEAFRLVKEAKQNANKKNRKIRTCSIIIAAAVVAVIIAILVTVQVIVPHIKYQNIVSCTSAKTYEDYSDWNEGDLITFGRTYDPHSDDVHNLGWIVLDKQEDKALIITALALETGEFEYEYDPREDDYVVTWKNCDLREDLNKQFFSDEDPDYYDKVQLSEDELDLVLETDVKTATENTKDYIFILSDEEVQKYMPKDEDRLGYDVFGGTSCWWLRDNNPDPEYKEEILAVEEDGSIGGETEAGEYQRWSWSPDGMFVNSRPAMWIRAK